MQGAAVVSIRSRRVLIGVGSLAVVLVACAIVVAIVRAAETPPAEAAGAVRPPAAPRPAIAMKPESRPAPRAKPKPEPKPREHTPRPVTPRRIKLPPLAQARILVEKADHRLTVFDGNRPVKTYRCAVGAGRGDKTREGDRCTPEGQFRVCVKNPASNYTRALGLDYPNAEDARRGLRDGLITRARHDAIVEAVSQGRRPPWNTPLGGEIMIHGAGQGRDWTRGCIALDDADILELYPAIGLHTPVTILP